MFVYVSENSFLSSTSHPWKRGFARFAVASPKATMLGCFSRVSPPLANVFAYYRKEPSRSFHQSPSQPLGPAGARGCGADSGETQPLSEPGCGGDPGAGRPPPRCPGSPAGRLRTAPGGHAEQTHGRPFSRLDAGPDPRSWARAAGRLGGRSRARAHRPVREGQAVCAAGGTAAPACVLARGVQLRRWGAERGQGLQKARGKAACRQGERQGREGREASAGEAETKGDRGAEGSEETQRGRGLWLRRRPGGSVGGRAAAAATEAGVARPCILAAGVRWALRGRGASAGRRACCRGPSKSNASWRARAAGRRRTAGRARWWARAPAARRWPGWPG